MQAGRADLASHPRYGGCLPQAAHHRPARLRLAPHFNQGNGDGEKKDVREDVGGRA